MWRPHFYTVGHSCTAISLSSTYPEYLTLTVFLSPPHTPSHRPVFFSFQPFTHLLLHPGSHHLEPQPVHLRYLTSATNFLFYHFQSQTLAKPIVWFHQHLKQHLTFLTWQILSQSMSLFLSLPPSLSGPPAHSTTSTNTTYFPLSLLTEMRQHTMTETLIIGTKRRWYVQLWKRVLERRGCRQRENSNTRNKAWPQLTQFWLRQSQTCACSWFIHNAFYFIVRVWPNASGNVNDSLIKQLGDTINTQKQPESFVSAIWGPEKTGLELSEHRTMSFSNSSVCWLILPNTLIY